MRKFPILFLAFILIATLGILHFVAGAFYLYWTVGWFDYLMHFLAGLGGGLVVVWFLSGEETNQTRILMTVIVSVMIVGIAWEIFEYMNDIAQSTEGYALDTFHDLLMDALGVITAGIWGVKKIFYDRN